MGYDHMIAGRILKELREKKGLTQEVVSGLAGVARTHLAMIESGMRNPKVDTLWRICEVLDLRLSDLLRQVEEKTEEKARGELQ